METAKRRGEQELLLRRERLSTELEKLSRRMKEFEECSELDMMHQVGPESEAFVIAVVVCTQPKHYIF